MKVWRGLKEDYKKFLLYQDGIKVEFKSHYEEEFFFIFAGVIFIMFFVFYWNTL